MSLKTYPRWMDVGDTEKEEAFLHVEGCGDPTCEQLKPGDWVRHRIWDGHGMVVSIDDDNIMVLWSVEPRGPLNAFGNIAFPLVRRVFPQLIAQQLVQVQPMSQPSGMIFYMDYVCGGDNDLATKCNSGPFWRRMFWRGHRWVRPRIRQFGSSLRSCWSWWRSKRITRGSTAVPRLGNGPGMNT